MASVPMFSGQPRAANPQVRGGCPTDQLRAGAQAALSPVTSHLPAPMRCSPWGPLVLPTSDSHRTDGVFLQTRMRVHFLNVSGIVLVAS